MRNQPEYKFLKNWKYAINGFFEVLSNEKAFKIELVLFMIIGISLVFLEISIIHKLIIVFSMFVVVITELLNSAIERVVDLVTKDHHELAKHAKDAAAAAVMFSNFLLTGVCLYFIYIDYIKDFI